MHACAIILGSDVRFRASQHSQGSCSLQRVCNREPLTPSKSVTVPHLSRTALPDHCGHSCVPHPLTRASRPRSRKHAVRDTRRAYGPAISLVSSVCSAMLIALIKHYAFARNAPLSLFATSCSTDRMSSCSRNLTSPLSSTASFSSFHVFDRDPANQDRSSSHHHLASTARQVTPWR